MSSSPCCISWAVIAVQAASRAAGRGRCQRPAERVGQRVHPVAERPGAALHQAVGVQREGGARRQADLGRLERLAAQAERQPGRQVEHVGAAVGAGQQRRQMPGLGDQAAALGRVEHRVDAGGERGAGQARGQPVQSAQHGRRGQLQVGQGMRGGAQLHHDRGRLRAVAHHVTDDQHRPPAGHRHDVIPVAADHVRADRPVPVRDLQARWHLRPGRQQATLQGQRGAPLLAVAPRVVQAGRRAVGQPAGQFGVVRAERRPAAARANVTQPSTTPRASSGTAR